MSEFVLANGVGVVDFVPKDEEGDPGELLHGEKGVELGLGLDEALVVFGVNEEDDAADFGEVVFPEAAGYFKSVRGMDPFGFGWQGLGLISPCW